MEVTVLKVIDPSKPADDSFHAERGKRLVSVRLRLTNVGTLVYDDTPRNGAVMIDRDGQQHDAGVLDPVEPALDSPRIQPGESRVGFITFEIIKGIKLHAFQLTLDSGFGPETGEWRLSG
jgi:hypothetical protein